MYSLNKKKYFLNKLFLGNNVLNIACLNPSQYTVEKINGWITDLEADCYVPIYAKIYRSNIALDLVTLTGNKIL